MRDSTLLHDLIATTADRSPDRPAVSASGTGVHYAELQERVQRFSSGLLTLGIARTERVAIYLEKRLEVVVAAFGAAASGAVFVPINPLLKPEQVGYILRDCNVRVLVTSAERLQLLSTALVGCHDLRHVVVVGGARPEAATGAPVHAWDDVIAGQERTGRRVIDTDMAAILYTSGSTGRPKGVVLSHRNMVAGAKSVAQYLENNENDTLLAALPLSFDAGFSQLTTSFHSGARVVLINYLFPMDVVQAVVKERVTGLTAVPPLWIQLSQLRWPDSAGEHLRYFANTGGRMPVETLRALRKIFRQAKPYLMYGLTEAFRSTYLPPEEAERRPDSIGKAIPNAEILVLRDDGTECAPNEAGELVHRGALVAMGYWNDAEKTAERFKPLPHREPGLVLPEIAVFSGDTVRRDEDGFLYFIGRRDEMIKTSGYRVSPTEVEEVLYCTGRVGEAAAFGVPHPTLGQAIVVVATKRDEEPYSASDLLAACRADLPIYMVPAHIDFRPAPLPRNANGKIDRKQLAAEFAGLYEHSAS